MKNKAKGDILIVIAARGGSKGLKNKNIRLLAGKPLIAYSIRQAINWNKAEHIICSTDSAIIAEAAKKYGAEVFFKRPAKLSGDSVGKIPVLRHAVKMAEKAYKRRFGIVVDLDVTAPVRTAEDLDSMLRIFGSKKPDCLFSVTKARKSPYFNMVERRKDGTVVLCKKIRKKIVRRQDAPCVFSMNASIYFYSRDFLVNPRTKMPYDGKNFIYEMNIFSAVDIDSEIDFQWVEFLLKRNLIKL